MFWRWVVVLHDRLHDARDKMLGAEFEDAFWAAYDAEAEREAALLAKYPQDVPFTVTYTNND